MSDKPILFSAPMVRALLAGTKTQTRRVIKGATAICREPGWEAHRAADGAWRIMADTAAVRGEATVYLDRAVGDRLYVREWIERAGYGGEAVGYPADGSWLPNTPWRWSRSGIASPRDLSRITLTVTDVRVQRLQDITNDDCIAEGVPVHPNTDAPRTGLAIDDFARRHGLISHYGGKYRRIWNAINGARSWNANPWVAAYTFTVALGNIDQIARAA